MQESKQTRGDRPAQREAVGTEAGLPRQEGVWADQSSSADQLRQLRSMMDKGPRMIAQRQVAKAMDQSPSGKALRSRALQMNAVQAHDDTLESEDSEDVLHSDEADAGQAEAGDQPESEEDIFEAQREAIPLLGETHHLEYRKVGSEFVLGVASTWAEAAAIHTALRLRGVSAAWRASYLVVRGAHDARTTALRDLQTAERQLDALPRERRSRSRSPAPRGGRGGGRAGSGARSRSRSRSRERNQPSEADRLRQAVLDLRIDLINAIGQERRAVNAFVAISANEFSTEVAEILGANMPAIKLDTDVVVADANTVRYHTGDQADPIPITWYKPTASYATVTVLDGLTNANVVLSPFAANPQVAAPDGTTYQLGVTAANHPVIGDVLLNNPKHGKTRTRQQLLNTALTSMGYNMAGQDGDHVKDLGFGGSDIDANFWPLTSATNRYAFTGWRSSYYLNYKTGTQGAGGAQIVKKAPLNAGNMVGKYVQIVAEQATASPNGNNSAASGSSTAWGQQENIIARNGAAIAEA
ncbi:hypothetical protein ACEN9F_06460 [Duganella sp. CT11-25]|uniref:hypothetical protein n=1 Tax=unclassified Duganella TaxID=2636909 RepID=UPI0039B02163